MGELSRLKGLGPKSERCLNEIGIHTRRELEDAGPVQAYLRLQRAGMNPSLNFLYAMVGALQDCHWNDIARSERARLLAELDGAKEAEELMSGGRG